MTGRTPLRVYRQLQQEDAEVYHDRLTAPAGTWLGRMRRTPRRVLTGLAASAGLAALVLPVVLADETAQWVYGVGALMLMLLVNLALFLATRLGGGLPDAATDERGRQVRDRAMRVAHGVVPLTLVLVGGALLFVAGDDGLTLTSAQAYLPATVGFVQLALPTWIVAWTEPEVDVADGERADPGPRHGYPWSSAALMGVLFAAFQLVWSVRDGWEPLPDLGAAVFSGLFFAVVMRAALTWVRNHL